MIKPRRKTVPTARTITRARALVIISLSQFIRFSYSGVTGWGKFSQNQPGFGIDSPYSKLLVVLSEG
jgi:hypothetical protein